MTEDFKKWLCELTGYSIFIDTNKECNLIALLIKAYWKCKGKDYDDEIGRIKKYLKERYNEKN